jgi:sugar O-acyltransferase (sialic acid O-acetyltransferase NeuD family)
MNNLMILGASGNALDILDIIDSINDRAVTDSERWQVDGLLDDRLPEGSLWRGLLVRGALSLANAIEDRQFIMAIGSDKSYRSLPALVNATGIGAHQWATLIHSGAAVSRSAKIGKGVYIQFGSSIAGLVHLEDHVKIAANATIGHETRIGWGTIVAPGVIISGGVVVHRNVYIGAGAVIRQGLEIGEGSLIGMGAVVVKDVPAHSIVAGNPARNLYE